MKYKESDIILVKLSGLEVPAVIKSVLQDSEYIVQFESGNEKIVHAKYIKDFDSETALKFQPLPQQDETNTTTRRSPSRRSPARNISPARTVSPSRRAKPSSPSRKKSPSRKSQILKPTVTELPEPKVTPPSYPRRRRPIDQLIELPLNSTTEIIDESSKKIDYEAEANKDFILEEKQFILHLKAQEDVLQDIGKFSDDEEVKIIRKSLEKERISQPKPLIPSEEFGGVFGALFMIFLLPVSVISLHLSYNYNSSEFSTVLEPYKYLSTYFDVNVWSIYMCYLVLISVLSLLPFGGKQVSSQPSKNKKRTYRMNGLFSAFLIYTLLTTLEWHNIPIIDFICDNYFKFLTTSLIFGTLFSIVLYVKSSYEPVSSLNTHAVTYNCIYDFFMGRELNPTFLGLDVKIITLRSSLIGILLLNSMFIYKSLNIDFTLDASDFTLEDLDFAPTLLLACILQMVYVLDVLVFESALPTTFEVQYEGAGYLAIAGYAAYPFLPTAVTKYLYESQMELNEWSFGAILFVYTAGYIICRASNAQKNAFRLNPYDPAFAHMETIPTNQGKRLLVSGYWGWLRHPNYLGDILMHAAMSTMCWWSPACLGVFLSIPLLLHRAARIDDRCKRRYGPAWDRYCQRVKYRVIPRVY